MKKKDDENIAKVLLLKNELQEEKKEDMKKSIIEKWTIWKNADPVPDVVERGRYYPPQKQDADYI